MIQIKDKTKCCGCSACVQKCPKQCIVMIEDEEGFLYPQVDIKKCNDCGLCDKVCPLQHNVDVVEPIKVLGAYNKNEAIRLKSSSGGIFTLLAERTINNGGIVFGAKFNSKWDVVLDYSETIEGIEAFRGSKYVQASVNNTFTQCEQFLKTNRQVLFSGTPCQIAGLKKYLAKQYDNLLTVDVVCHGVPSPMVWRRYLNELTNDITQIDKISFRDKSQGWKKYRFILKTQDSYKNTKACTIDESSDENIFMESFISDLTIRPSCFNCPFRGLNHRQADISIADYWGVEDFLPDLDDDKGLSLVMLNTINGIKACALEQLKYRQTYLQGIQKYNGGFADSLNYNPRRERFFNKIRTSKRIVEQMKIHTLPEKQYKQKTTPTHRKFIRKLKSKMATIFGQ